MEKILRHNGVEMLYTVEGEGSPVILMHGWGCTHETVRVIADVAVRSHKVYNVDFPGFGRSTEPDIADGVWGVEEYTRVIEALAAEEGIVNPILIGHSFGGRVAIVFASRNQVDKVVLVDAAGVKPRRSLKYHIRVKSFKLLKRLARLLPGSLADKATSRLRAFFGSKDYSASSRTMQAILSKVVNEDLCHLMPLIKAPTLLIWGKNDTATPLRDAEKMERLIPDAGLVAFDGCGHYSFLDNRPAFCAVLNNFIN